MSHIKKTFKDYITVLFGSGFARGVALLNSVIIARILGPEEFGKFSIFYVVMILTWIFPEAFDVTFVRYAKASNSKDEKKDFLKSAVFLKILYAIGLLSLSYPIAYALANYCFHKPEISLFLIMAFVCGIFLSFLKTIASIFQEKEKFIEFAGLHAVYTILIFIGLMFLRTIGFAFSLKNVILVYLGISIIIGASSIYLLFKKIGPLFPLHLQSLKTSFAFGKWIFGVTCIYYVFQRLDTLFLTRYVKFESIGIYSVAVQLIMAISVIAGSLSGIFLPKASKALGSEKLFKVYVRESFLGISMINIFIIVLMIAAPFIVKILYGNEYLLASPILRILLVGWFFAAIYAPFSFLFYAMEDSKTRFVLELTKIILVIILLSLLVPLYGVRGGAIAISGALLANTIISFAVLQTRLVRIKKEFAIW
jgi:O-antigen/teichoic acid export membrane protein